MKKLRAQLHKMGESVPAPQSTPTWLVAAAASLLLVDLARAEQSASTATVPRAIAAKAACDTLSGKTVGEVVLATSIVAKKGGMPTYCRVTGTTAPSLNFEIRLPNA